MKQKHLLLISVISLMIDANSQTACTYTQGFYGTQGPNGCYNNSSIASSTQFMLNAFGVDQSVVFGSVANKRFFTLYKTDITNGNIFKMLPGAKPGKAIGVDNVLPYDGAFYGDPSTWSLVPISTITSSYGRIDNLLLAHTITLWFNVRTSTSLGTIALADTLVTTDLNGCGGPPIGSPVKFALPHDLIVFFSGLSGYKKNVNGLLKLANNVLGGAHSPVPITTLVQAMDVITQAFLECRTLTGSISASVSNKNSEQAMEMFLPDQKTIALKANPNPSASNFTITISSPEQNSSIRIKVLDLQGRTIEDKTVLSNSRITIGEDYGNGVYIVKGIQGKNVQHLKLVKY